MSSPRVIAVSNERWQARDVIRAGASKFKVSMTHHPDFNALLATGDIKVCLRPGQGKLLNWDGSLEHYTVNSWMGGSMQLFRETRRKSDQGTPVPRLSPGEG